MKNRHIIKICVVLITLSFSSANKQPSEACNMLIAIDSRLYDHFNKDINNVTSMAKDLVQKMSEVYEK